MCYPDRRLAVGTPPILGGVVRGGREGVLEGVFGGGYFSLDGGSPFAPPPADRLVPAGATESSEGVEMGDPAAFSVAAAILALRVISPTKCALMAADSAGVVGQGVLDAFRRC